MNSDDYARAIIAEGQRRGITPHGIQIALATALVESGDPLQMWANSKVPESLALPHDNVGSDGYSVGLFQQQIVMGANGWWWSDTATCMNPTLSAGLFYDRLAKLDYNNGDPGAKAQQIQQSAFPDRYNDRFDDAVDLYNRLAGQPSPQFYPAAAHQVFRQHLGEDYVYGGLDCSGLVDLVLTALTTGTVDGWRRHVTTESWDPGADVGDRGPFGSVKVSGPNGFSPNAVATIAIHHGGGGPDSHINVVVDGEYMESNGDHGICTLGSGAIPQNSSYWTDWWEIVGDTCEGVFMALTDAEQRELLDLARQLAAYRRPSRSPLRHLGEGNVDTVAGFDLNSDANIHVLLCEHLAELGDPNTTALLREVASANPVTYPDRQEDAKLAKAILNKVAAAGTPSVATPTGPMPGITPTPVIPQTPPPVAPAPAAVEGAPTGSGIASQLAALQQQIDTAIRTVATINQ